MAIKQEANRLKMKYQTTDPYDICTSMDIQVIKRPMGASAQSCKGFFLVSSRCKLIVINSDLPESIQRIIIAHELGHAVLHSDSAISAFHEFAMFDDTDRMEYEANVFAAEFMLSDDGSWSLWRCRWTSSRWPDVCMYRPSCWTSSCESCSGRASRSMPLTSHMGIFSSAIWGSL